MSERTITVVGIDPGVRNAGIALGDDSLNIKAQGITVEKETLGQDLVFVMADRLSATARTGNLILLEGYAYGKQGKSSSITDLAEVCGIIKYTLMDLPLIIVTPGTVKKYATGKGTGQKHDLILAAYKEGVEFKNTNACDAYWICRIGLGLLGKDHKLNATRKKIIEEINKRLKEEG